MDLQKALEIIVKGIEENKSRILMGADAKIVSFLERLFPIGYWELLHTIRRL